MAAAGGAACSGLPTLPLPEVKAPQPLAAPALSFAPVPRPPSPVPEPAAVTGVGPPSARAFLAFGTLMPAAFIVCRSSLASRRRSFSSRSDVVAVLVVSARCVSASAFRRCESEREEKAFVQRTARMR